MNADTTVATAVKNEHLKNKPLLIAVEDTNLTEAEKELVKVLLRVGETIPGMGDDQNIKNAYKDKFVTSRNVHEFIEKLIPGTTNPEIELKEKISRELTSDVYRGLRKSLYKEIITTKTTEEKLDLVKGINFFLEKQQEKKPTLEKYQKHLKELEKDFDALPYLYSGANEANANKKAKEMIKDYDALAKQCDTLIEHLESAKSDLQVRLEGTKPIPASDDTEPNKKLIRELTRLHIKLDEEISDIDEKLKFFNGVKKQIAGKDGTIEKIKGIMNRQLTVVEESASISYSEIDRGSEKTADFQQKPEATALDMTELFANQNPNSPTYKLQKIPQKNQLLCMDITHVKSTPTQAEPYKQTEYKGRIVIDYYPSAPVSTLKGKNVSHSRPTKVVIVNAMKDDNYLAEQMTLAAKHILKDWDGKSSIKLKGVHGKEKELAFLWTADAF